MGRLQTIDPICLAFPFRWCQSQRQPICQSHELSAFFVGEGTLMNPARWAECRWVELRRCRRTFVEEYRLVLDQSNGRHAVLGR